MVTVVIISMLCVHLLCFSVMFLLISTRLYSRKMGMEVFALGNLLLGLAYILQLFEEPSGLGILNVLNHTLTFCAPVVYVLGAMRFFGRAIPVWLPLIALVVLYTALQGGVQWVFGSVGRHALLAAACALLFLAMAAAALYGRSSFAKDLRVEMLVFAILIAGICLLNAIKFLIVVTQGLPGLDVDSHFQTGFYLYMSFLGTVLPPCAVWLVLRRLTDELSVLATHDPLTRVLNRRGLLYGVQAYFRQNPIGTAYVMIVDIDHFKRINDSHGHSVGDQILRHVAQCLTDTARQGDLICRLGGEEFVLLAFNTDHAGAMQLAERARLSIERTTLAAVTARALIGCTVSIGVSDVCASEQDFDVAMQQADAALYSCKRSGRNCVGSAVLERKASVQLPLAFEM